MSQLDVKSTQIRGRVWPKSVDVADSGRTVYARELNESEVPLD